MPGRKGLTLTTYCLIRYNAGERPNSSVLPLIGTHIEQQADALKMMNHKVQDEEASYARVAGGNPHPALPPYGRSHAPAAAGCQPLRESYATVSSRTARS